MDRPKIRYLTSPYAFSDYKGYKIENCIERELWDDLIAESVNSFNYSFMFKQTTYCIYLNYIFNADPCTVRVWV